MTSESVSIDASQIGIKEPIKVLTSYRNVRQALVFNRDSLQYEEDSESDDPLKSLEGTIAVFDNVADYLAKTLGLSKKQADKLQDLDVIQLVAFGRSTATAILHGDDSEETESDQKSDAE